LQANNVVTDPNNGSPSNIDSEALASSFKDQIYFRSSSAKKVKIESLETFSSRQKAITGP
jgi:hypothetical protein